VGPRSLPLDNYDLIPLTHAAEPTVYPLSFIPQTCFKIFSELQREGGVEKGGRGVKRHKKARSEYV